MNLDWLFSKPLPVGAQAPDFRLETQDGKEVTLSSLCGRYVVLIFYPGDDTPGCTRQLCQFRDHWGQAKELGVVVLGVNPQSAGRHAKFRSRFNLPFDLLVDKGREAARAYSASGLIVKRTVYLIGPEGKILFSRRGMPSPAEVLALVR
jgi:thioredoxin-dependent peroxiredoxin